MGPVVRLEGLPFRVTKSELRDFFSDCKLADDLDSIHIILNHDGRASGLGYVELASEEDVEPATNMSNKDIGDYSRSANVVECKMEELQWYLNRKEILESKKYRVHMSGLPYRATEYEIATWFGTKANCCDVEIHLNKNFRPSGEGTAFFDTEAQVEEAMKMDKEDLQGRYIGLTVNTSGPLSRKGFFVKMSGLPYRATQEEIKKFFSTVGADCVSVRIVLNSTGRASGDAIAEFETEDDVKTALTKDRQHIGTRFIILTRLDGDESTIQSSRGEKYPIRMGGLPYRATISEIREWFEPEAECDFVKILSAPDGRPSGEAIAEFKTLEMAQKAMTKNRDYMGERFVILTPQY